MNENELLLLREMSTRTALIILTKGLVRLTIYVLGIAALVKYLLS